MAAIDGCESARRRTCDLGDEEQVASEEEKRHETERAAEARRNAYSSGDEDVGGRCKGASSDASKMTIQSDDDPALRDSQRTQAIDKPLADDFIGNLIPSLVVAGIGGAIRGGAGEAAAVVGEDAAKAGAQEAVDTTFRNMAEAPAAPPAKPEPHDEPLPVGRDRVPYAPGQAPVQIPEAPVVICG